MPVIVVGADTPLGRAIVQGLATGRGEVRAFVSGSDEAPNLRHLGVKVAIGDVSDESHVGAAAAGAFCAVLIVGAATDGRSLSFATPAEVPAGWVRAVATAGVRRVIVVGEAPPLGSSGVAEIRMVSTGGHTMDQIVAAVAALDEADRL